MEFTKDTIEIKELEVFWKELFKARSIQSLTSAQFELHIKPFREKLEQIGSNVKHLRGDGIVKDVRIDRHENPKVKWGDYSHLVSISITMDSLLINEYSGSK